MLKGKKILSGLALAGAAFGGATIINTEDTNSPVSTEQAQVVVLDEQASGAPVEQGEVSEETQTKAETRTEAETEIDVDENTLKGEEFFDTYISGEGAVVVSEDIAYKALAYGSEEDSAGDADQVRIIGKKLDGTVFENPGDQTADQTIARSESEDLIPGLFKVLQTMKPGDKREIIIAPLEAYGSKDLVGKVEPNETLIYEVEVISADQIRKQEEERAAQKEKEEADRIAEEKRIKEAQDAQDEKDRQAKEAEEERKRQEIKDKPPVDTQPQQFQQSGCDPNYTGCVPIASDVDCAGGSGNGPEYTGRVNVIGRDIYDLDRDGDGVACQNS